MAFAKFVLIAFIIAVIALGLIVRIRATLAARRERRAAEQAELERLLGAPRQRDT